MLVPQLKITDFFSEFREFKIVTTLVSEFKKAESEDETKYSIFYLNSISETVMKESDIDDAFESIYVTIRWHIV